MSIRMVEAPLSLEYDLLELDEMAFKREYQQLSESDDDPIAQWLKLAKAKGETAESDPVLLNLLVELHRKVDNLERLIKDEKPKRLTLRFAKNIAKIGFEHFALDEAGFEPSKRYYGRIEMPIYPKRDVAVLFVAVDEKLAKIEQMHERDEREWASYLTARERVLIRQMRGKK